MKTKKAVLEWLCFIFVTSMALGASVEYIPKGPKETQEFEKGLYKSLPVYISGIYPKDTILATGVSEKDLPSKSAERMTRYKHSIETWLARILKTGLKPKKFNTGSWLGIRKLRWDTNYIVGRYVIADEKCVTYKGTIVEFQADDRSMDLTITSPSLFAADANDLSDAKIIQLTNKVLNMPKEKLSKIKIEKHFITVAGIDLCNGKMLCEWDPKESVLETREWWSYIPFWYIKGKFCLGVSIVDWKKGAPASRRTGGWKF